MRRQTTRFTARIAAVVGIAVLGMVLGLGGCSETSHSFCELGVACEGASVQRCADGVEARQYGRAAFDGATCVAEAGACSRSSLTCKVFGQCAAPPRIEAATGECAGDDGDYRASNLARCAGHGTCIAADDAGCEASSYCRLEGRCKADNGVCVAKDDETCLNSNYCADLGWCARVETVEGPRCRARNPADCLASAICRKTGDCGVSATGQCTDCIRSVGCLKDGLCDLEGDRCIAISNPSCQRSEACRSGGRCRAFQGTCVSGR